MEEVQHSPFFQEKSTGEGEAKMWSEEKYIVEQSKTEFLLNTHKLVVDSKKSNFEFCRIPVNDRLNILFLRHMLSDYRDFQVCDLLEFAFPLGCSEDIRNLKSNTRIKNHKGAREFPSEIKSYLESELCKDTVLGPFKENPFQTQLLLSPLNTVPKHDTNERRVILDLSFSKGHAVNDFIPKDEYLQEKIDLVYPKVDDLVDLVKLKGQDCCLFKKDLQKAFRQICIDPLE